MMGMMVGISSLWLQMISSGYGYAHGVRHTMGNVCVCTDVFGWDIGESDYLAMICTMVNSHSIYDVYNVHSSSNCIFCFYLNTVLYAVFCMMHMCTT